MAKARAILKRIKAIKSTRTITKTMEMISTARFKRTHDRVVAARPYTDRMASIVGDLVGSLTDKSNAHPLLVCDESVKRDVLLVMTANRGLCGSYNSAVLRLALERRQQLRDAGGEVLLHVVGKRGVQFLKFRNHKIELTYTQFDYMPKYEDVSKLADELIEQFIQKKIGGLEVAYTQFVSSSSQKPAIAQVLPLSVLPPARELPAVSTVKPIYEFLPSSDHVLSALLPAAVRLRLYQCFLDAAVSEQMARMTSMRSASDNADDILHDLTVRYNRTRQGQITTELAEIMGGRVGLEE